MIVIDQQQKNKMIIKTSKNKSGQDSKPGDGTNDS